MFRAMLQLLVMMFVLFCATRAVKADPPPEDVLKGAISGGIEALFKDRIRNAEYARDDNWNNKRQTQVGKKKGGLWKAFSVKPEDVDNKTHFRIGSVSVNPPNKVHLEVRL